MIIIYISCIIVIFFCFIRCKNLKGYPGYRKMFKSYEEQKDFEKWAFGTSTPCYECIGMLHDWNSRHGDIYMAKDTENQDDSLKLMYQFYKERNEYGFFNQKSEKGRQQE